MAKSNEPMKQPLEDTINSDVFKEEVKVWAKRIGVEYKSIQLRSMKNKWGSCSSKGRLTFDKELLKQPASFRAKIIAHELLHLRIPHHGRLFESMLKSYLSKYG